MNKALDDLKYGRFTTIDNIKIKLNKRKSSASDKEKKSKCEDSIK